jgi:hypothetical protein
MPENGREKRLFRLCIACTFSEAHANLDQPWKFHTNYPRQKKTTTQRTLPNKVENFQTENTKKSA